MNIIDSRPQSLIKAAINWLLSLSMIVASVIYAFYYTSQSENSFGVFLGGIPFAFFACVALTIWHFLVYLLKGNYPHFSVSLFQFLPACLCAGLILYFGCFYKDTEGDFAFLIEDRPAASAHHLITFNHAGGFNYDCHWAYFECLPDDMPKILGSVPAPIFGVNSEVDDQVEADTGERLESVGFGEGSKSYVIDQTTAEDNGGRHYRIYVINATHDRGVVYFQSHD